VNQDKDQAEPRLGEDYGGPADYSDSSAQGTQGKGNTENVEAGKYSGGTTGTTQGSNEGEKFGDFDRTGTGVDLTEEMENTDARTGLVKGGEHDADDVAGPAQYGGDAGSLNKGQ
jgi:hypothetical protein